MQHVLHDSTTAAGSFWDRADAVAVHDEMRGLRAGNRLGDRLGLSANEHGDNAIGRIIGAIGDYYGTFHGMVSSALNPAYCDSLIEQSGGDPYAAWNGPRR